MQRNLITWASFNPVLKLFKLGFTNVHKAFFIGPGYKQKVTDKQNQ